MTYDERQQQKLQRSQPWRTTRMLKRMVLPVIVGALLVAGWKWLTIPGSSTSPGQSIPNLGRQHVPVGTAVEYNSNPPTSGPHYEEWEKTGIYDRPLTDGKLVHSLEHGYVIISYNCTKLSISNLKSLPRRQAGQISNLFRASAHETEEPHEESATESGEITEEERQESTSIDVSGWKDDPDCQSLVSELERIAKKLRVWKLIVVPRPNLDSRIALTAWTKLDTFDEPDEDRIAAFVKAYRDKGPEKTME